MAFSLRLWLLVLVVAAVVRAQEPTVLSYLVEYEEEERQDFLELTVSTRAFRMSLHEAIAEAKEKAQKIKALEEEICRSLAKDKAECKESAEIGNVQIEPKYQTNKKVTTYEGVSASYEIVIKVNNPEYFGQLVDRILAFEGFVIDKIEWQPDEELIEDTFLAESLEKSKELCGELGLAFGRLVSVEELREEPEQPEEEEEPAEEEEEEQEEQEEQEEPEEESDATLYRITVECVKKQPKQKQPKQKQGKNKQAAKK